MADFLIKLHPHVADFIETLPLILEREGYKSSYEYAERYVDELVDFIYDIPNLQAHDIPEKFSYHFERYGRNLRYVFFRLKGSPTTWYVFFEQHENKILVMHISNNWTEGQYIRG